MCLAEGRRITVILSPKVALTFCLRAGRACCGPATPLWSTGEPVFFYFSCHGCGSKATKGFTFQTLNTGSTKSSLYLTDTFCSRGQQQAPDKPASVNVLIFPLVLLGTAGFPTDGCLCVPLKGTKCTFLGKQDKQLRRTAVATHCAARIFRRCSPLCHGVLPGG